MKCSTQNSDVDLVFVYKSTFLVYLSHSVTHTKQSPTLFIRNIAGDTNVNDVKKIFATEPGFTGSRHVNRIVFIDFESIKDSTAAMRKFQGWKPEGLHAGHEGIVIDCKFHV